MSTDAELATLVCHYIRSHPELFQGEVVQRARLAIVTWEDELREATDEEAERITKHLDFERLKKLVSRTEPKTEGNLLFPLKSESSRQAHVSRQTLTADLVVKSLRRLHTAYAHKFINSATLTWTPAPVYSVRIHGDFVFTGADDWTLRKFKINRSPSSPDEPSLMLQTTYYGHQSVVTDFVVFDFAHQTTFLCSCSPDRTVRVYRVAPDDVFVCYLSFDADVPYIGEHAGNLVACSEAGELVVVPGQSFLESGAANSPGGLFRGRGLRRVFASATRHTQVRGFFLHDELVYLALSDKTIKIYNISSCNLVHSLDVLRLHSKSVSEIAALKTQRWHSGSSRFRSQELLASSDDSGNLVLWKDRAPTPLLSTLHGAVRLAADQSLLEKRLKRLDGRLTNLFFSVDVTAFMKFESLRSPLLLASLGVFTDRYRESLVYAVVLVFDTDSGELVDVVESFENRVFVIRPIDHSDCVMIAGHDGDLAILRVGIDSKLVEINRFSIATPHRVTRSVLDACVKTRISSPAGNRPPQLLDLTIACADSFGSVSLFGASEVGGLVGLDEEELQKYKDAYSHQFFVGDYGVEPPEASVRVGAQICDSRGRTGRLHHFPEDPLPIWGSGYEFRAKPGLYPVVLADSLGPRVPSGQLGMQLTDSSEDSQRNMLIDVVDAGDMSDSSDTSFSSSDRRVPTATRRNRNVVRSSDDSSGETDLTSLVSERDESSDSSDSDGSFGRNRRRQSRMPTTRSRSIMGVFLSPAPSPPRRSTRPRRQVRYDFSDEDEDVDELQADEAPPAVRMTRGRTRSAGQEDAAPVVEDLWLACDHCDRWRRVTREVFDEYNGTDKVVRCRRIGRSCDEPDDNPEVPEAPEPEPEPEPESVPPPSTAVRVRIVRSAPSETPLPPPQLGGDESPRTATGMTLRRRTRVSSPPRDSSPRGAHEPTVDLARLRQERAERRERLRIGQVSVQPQSASAAGSGSGRVLRRRTRAERSPSETDSGSSVSESSSPESASSSSSSSASRRPRQPQRSARRVERFRRNLRSRRN